MKNGVSQKVRMVLSLYAAACLALDFSSLSSHNLKKSLARQFDSNAHAKLPAFTNNVYLRMYRAASPLVVSLIIMRREIEDAHAALFVYGRVVYLPLLLLLFFYYYNYNLFILMHPVAKCCSLYCSCVMVSGILFFAILAIME